MSAVAAPFARPEPRADAEPRASLILRLTTGNVPRRANLLGWTAFALLAVAGLSQALIGVDPQDEGQLLTYPWLIAHGILPYRDFWMSYPPATYAILAVLFKAGIPGLLAERSLSVVARLLYVLLVNRALTGSWSRFSWTGTPAAFCLLVLSSEIRAYPWVVGLPLLLPALLTTRKNPALAAVLFFLAGTVRFEFGLAGIAALGGLALLSWVYRERERHAAVSAVALALVLAIFFLLLDALTGGRAIRDIFLDPILVVDPAHRLPLFPPYFGPVGVPLELAVIAAPLGLLLYGLRKRQPYLAASSLGLLSLLPQLFQRADWEHLFAVAAVVVPCALMGLRDVAMASEAVMQVQGRSRRSAQRLLSPSAAMTAMALTVTAWYALVIAAYGLYLSPLSPLSSESLLHGWSRHVVHAGPRTIVAESRVEAADDTALLRYLRRHAAPGERMFVAPRTLRYLIYNHTDLYYLLDIPPASSYLEMLPGLEKRAATERQIIRDLRRCTWVILWNGGFSREPNPSVVPGSPLLERYIVHHYTTVLRNHTYWLMRLNESAVHTASSNRTGQG